MSKIGHWVLEMQEDAQFMSEYQFVELHGESQRQVWVDENNTEKIDNDTGDP